MTSTGAKTFACKGTECLLPDWYTYNILFQFVFQRKGIYNGVDVLQFLQDSKVNEVKRVSTVKGIRNYGRIRK